METATTARNGESVPFLYQKREEFEVSMGGTTASNVSSVTKRASEMGPDD